MEFGEVLMTLRIKNKQNLEEMSKLLGVTEDTLRAWELGKNTPSEKEIKKLSIYFNADIKSIAKTLEENVDYVKVTTLNDLIND